MDALPPPSRKDIIEYFYDTLKHKFYIMRFMFTIAFRLMWRAIVHDASKLNWKEEGHLYAAVTVAHFKNVTYNSDEYKRLKLLIKPAADHHYKSNSHHPEFYGDPPSVKPMSALDEIEMICDWLAASKRHHDGNPIKSVEINAEKFDYGTERIEFYKKLITEIR